jgi:aspartyl-tRNA(Asn)/glutamyl-tRNA(Gln) amidotransferase subunit C
MQVDEATVRRIARLARIKITEAEAKGLVKELSGILNWVEQLDEVDTAVVEPMTRVVPIELKKRADVVNDGGIADDIVRNAPIVEDHYFVVPKVVGDTPMRACNPMCLMLQYERQCSLPRRLDAGLATSPPGRGDVAVAAPPSPLPGGERSAANRASRDAAG